MSSMAVSYRRQEMLALDIMGDCLHPRFVVGSVLLIVFVFYVVFLSLLPVPLNCPFLIATSVFSNVY
jgi:hypothetical protein